MAKRKQKRSIRKLTKTRDAARLRESRLQEIEKLLGEDFETLAEAERALKEATKKQKNRYYLLVAEYPKTKRNPGKRYTIGGANVPRKTRTVDAVLIGDANPKNLEVHLIGIIAEYLPEVPINILHVTKIAKGVFTDAPHMAEIRDYERLH
jgi:hypothetical protein